MMTFEESIKFMRKTLRMSQREFAKEIGCSQTLISSFEIGIKKPCYDNLKKLSDFAKKHKIKITLL